MSESVEFSPVEGLLPIIIVKLGTNSFAVKEVRLNPVNDKQIEVEMNSELFQDGRTITIEYRNTAGLIIDHANNPLANGATLSFDGGIQ